MIVSGPGPSPNMPSQPPSRCTAYFSWRRSKVRRFATGAQQLQLRAVERVRLRLGAIHRDPLDAVVIHDPEAQLGVRCIEDDHLLQLGEGAIESEEQDEG